jgi:hypothetical protein
VIAAYATRDGALRVPIDDTFRLDGIADAHDPVDAGRASVCCSRLLSDVPPLSLWTEAVA